MVVAVALWSLELQPGKPEAFKVPNDLRVTNVALGAEVQDEMSRTSVKLTYKEPRVDSDEEDDDDDEEEAEEEQEVTTTVLCSLTPGKIEHALVDLILEEDQEVTFEVAGKNTVYLTGNYVDQTPAGGPNEDYDSDEEDYDSDILDSDVGSEDLVIDDEEDDSHRFEEIVEEEATKEKVEKKSNKEKKGDSKKRPRESDAMETEEQEHKPTKAEKKKLNKKLKAENGEAVAAGESQTTEKPKEKEGKKEKTRELAGGIKVQDHKVGSGPQVKNGDIVSMRYVGKLPNGKMFDSNTKGKPFKFRLGKGEVIKGWDLGIAGMQAGGERLLTIPPAMGYGKKAQGPIPANSTLIFEVKLIGIN